MSINILISQNSKITEHNRYKHDCRQGQIFHLLHRVVVFFVVHVHLDPIFPGFRFGAAWPGDEVHGHHGTWLRTHRRDGAIADSPLVQNVRKGSTAVRNDTIYLVTNSSHSFTTCTAIEGFDAAVYGISFTRF